MLFFFKREQSSNEENKFINWVSLNFIKQSLGANSKTKPLGHFKHLTKGICEYFVNIVFNELQKHKP